MMGDMIKALVLFGVLFFLMFVALTLNDWANTKTYEGCVAQFEYLGEEITCYGIRGPGFGGYSLRNCSDGRTYSEVSTVNLDCETGLGWMK